jgi:hypothetical protein
MATRKLFGSEFRIAAFIAEAGARGAANTREEPPTQK